MRRFRRRGYGRVRRFKRRRFGGYRRRRYGGRRTRTSLRRIVQSQISRNIETKELSWPTTTHFSAISTAWTEIRFGIDALAQGVGSQQYIGREVCIKAFYMWGWIQGGQTFGHLTDDEYNFFRIVIARWNHSAEMTPFATLGLTINDRINKNVFSTLRMMRKKYCDRMILIKPNRTTNVDDPYSTQHYGAFKFFKKRIVFKGRGLRLRAINPEQCIYVHMISDSVLPTNPGFIYGHIVMKYTDA